MVDMPRQRCSGYSTWRLLETQISVVAWAGLLENVVAEG